MTIIRVTPEILVMTSQRMAQVNGEIRAAVADLSSVLNGLGGEYEGQLRNQVASKVGQAQGAASGPTNRVSELTLELNKRAQLFAAADLQSTAVAGASAQLRQPVGAELNVWAQWQQLPLWMLKRILEMGALLHSKNVDLAIRALSAGIIAASLRPGSKYAGELSIRVPELLKPLRIIGYGARDIRSSAGVPTMLNHFKYSNLPSIMANKSLLGKVAIGLILADLASKWGQDVFQYKGTKVVSAILVDTVLTLAPTIVGILVSKLTIVGGAKLGAIIGTLICPGIGTGIGFAVGAGLGFLVGVGADLAMRWAIDHYNVRDKSIDWVDSKIMMPAAQKIQETKQKTVNWVDDNILAPTANAISNSMQSLSAGLNQLIPAPVPL